jgi:diguanylate cyclase (GGDEF)-like protein
MTGVGDGQQLVRLRVILALIAIAIGFRAPVADAAVVRLDRSLCHAVTGPGKPDDGLSTLHFACGDPARDYQTGSLWLRQDFRRLPVDRRELTLMIHQSRFDRLAVTFSYADGSMNRQAVRSGHFGEHWRAGGQIAFEAPDRDAPLVALTMRFDRLASQELLRMRLMSRGEAGVQSAALAASIGAALMLLLVGAIYNASLALAVRRPFLAWHGGWAACMLAWGALWSQLPLFVFPAMAGTVSAQICTGLACLAVALATSSVVTSLSGPALPKWIGRGAWVLGWTVAALGLPLSFIRSAWLQPFGDLLGVLILLDLVLVIVCLGWAWRRGSAEARDFAGAWAVPIAALGFTQFVDVDHAFWGGGSQWLVLCAAAWQTIWLSVAATRRLARLRSERDSARAAEAQAHELARRDPLTGLRNRRGFVETIAPMLGEAGAGGSPVALLLIDIDRFKSINDAHGHEAGDRVLCTIARRIERWEGPMCTAARLGGEEFALMVLGMEGFALARFADSVRLEIAACDHGDAIGVRRVTASIGIAEAHAASDFQQLYRLADDGLYAAKRQGRNRVVRKSLGEEAGGVRAAR